MTENKRFTMDNPNDWGFPITDNVTGKVYNCASNILMKELCVDVNTIVEENKQLKLQYSELEITLMNNQLAYNDLKEENEYYKSKCASLEEGYLKLQKENEQLKSENKRLTDKLNKTALELVDECISQGKATEISEMSYREFLDYCAENGKPMELHL